MRRITDVVLEFISHYDAYEFMKDVRRMETFIVLLSFWMVSMRLVGVLQVSFIVAFLPIILLYTVVPGLFFVIMALYYRKEKEKILNRVSSAIDEESCCDDYDD